MDGLIADTEPLWRKAEIEVFNKHGMPVTEAECEQVMGKRVDEVVKLWFEKYGFSEKSVQEIVHLVLEKLIELISVHLEPLPGVIVSLDYFKSKLPLAVASSSHKKLIDFVLNKLSITNRFSVICSAEFEAYGKPHPQIFLTTANRLNVHPSKCLVLEDSINGVIAAKAAGMQVIAVPEKSQLGNPKFSIADGVIPTLSELPEFLSNNNVTIGSY